MDGDGGVIGIFKEVSCILLCTLNIFSCGGDDIIGGVAGIQIDSTEESKQLPDVLLNRNNTFLIISFLDNMTVDWESDIVKLNNIK